MPTIKPTIEEYQGLLRKMEDEELLEEVFLKKAISRDSVQKEIRARAIELQMSPTKWCYTIPNRLALKNAKRHPHNKNQTHIAEVLNKDKAG